MSKKLGPFRILDKNGRLVWAGELKEFVFEDDYGRRMRGEILPKLLAPTVVKVKKRRRQ